MGTTLLFAFKALTSCRHFQGLLAAAAYPNGLDYQGLWLCLMVDREAIESMLRVYGPPATEIFTMGGPPRRKDIPFLPYLTAVSTDWEEENEDDVDDGEYHGDFKFALQCIVEIWESEQSITPDEYYPRDRSIFGDIGFSYEAPAGLR